MSVGPDSALGCSSICSSSMADMLTLGQQQRSSTPYKYIEKGLQIENESQSLQVYPTLPLAHSSV